MSLSITAYQGTVYHTSHSTQYARTLHSTTYELRWGRSKHTSIILRIRVRPVG